MRRTIHIGSAEVNLRASARTAVMMKDVFNIDVFKELPKMQNSVGVDAVDMLMKLAYIMHEQADGTAREASVERYEDWIDSFDLFPYEELSAVTALWMESTTKTAQPKN